MNTTLLHEINKTQTDTLKMCDAEKERILLRLKKEVKPKRFFALKGAGVLAASLAVLIGISVVNPVFAKGIPFVGDIVSRLTAGKTVNYQSPIINSGSVQAYLNAVPDAGDADFRILDTYCDGTALVLTTAAYVQGADPAVKVIEPTYSVKLNGEPLTVTNETTGEVRENLGDFFARMVRADDNNFIGTLVVDISKFELSGRFTLDIAVTGLTGLDTAYYVQDFRGAYKEKTYDITADFPPCTVTVNADRALERVYDVNATENGCTVSRIISTPAYTRFETDAGAYCDVKTQDGTRIEWLKFGVESSRNDYYKPLPENTTELTFTFYAKTDRVNPLATITVPVDGGYAQTLYTPVTPAGIDAVYDPPIDNAPQDVVRWGEASVALGETIESTYGATEGCDGKLLVTYSGMQVFDSAADFGLTEADMREMDEPLTREGMKFVTFDVRIESQDFVTDWNREFLDENAPEDEIIQELSSYEKNDGTASMHWITNFFQPQAKGYPMLGGDIDYFSGHMNGMTNYYHFAMNENDARDFTVGAFIPDELLTAGGLYIGVADGGRIITGLFSGAGRHTYVEVPAVQ